MGLLSLGILSMTLACFWCVVSVSTLVSTQVTGNQEHTTKNLAAVRHHFQDFHRPFCTVEKLGNTITLHFPPLIVITSRYPRQPNRQHTLQKKEQEVKHEYACETDPPPADVHWNVVQLPNSWTRKRAPTNGESLCKEITNKHHHSTKAMNADAKIIQGGSLCCWDCRNH